MSAAGSGKTFDICKDALLHAQNGERVLITTYTNRGAESVRREIRNQNDGVLHPLVVVKTWFTFLLSDMIKPYQRYLTGEVAGVKSIDFSKMYGYINRAKNGTKARYITSDKNVRANEASSLVCRLNQLSNGKVIERLAEIYQAVFFDEIQDLVGDDIEILQLLMESPIAVVCCGDNKQATFRTHNTKKNKKLTGKNVWQFFKELEVKGLVEIERNLASRRFNHQICCFANMLFPFGEPISTIMTEETEHDGVFLIDSEDVVVYHDAFSPQILRYDKDTVTYGYIAVNFGACKGETFSRVMIVPNKPLTAFITKGTALKSPEKYYVAVTRPKYSVAIVMAPLPKALTGYEDVMLDCKGTLIRALKYIAPDRQSSMR